MVAVRYDLNQDLLLVSCRTHTHTHTFNGPFSRTTRVSRYQKGKTQSRFYWSKRQWVAVASAGPYASLYLAPVRQPHQHPTALFLQAGCPSCHPTNSIKALSCRNNILFACELLSFVHCSVGCRWKIQRQHWRSGWCGVWNETKHHSPALSSPNVTQRAGQAAAWRCMPVICFFYSYSWLEVRGSVSPSCLWSQKCHPSPMTTRTAGYHVEILRCTRMQPSFTRDILKSFIQTEGSTVSNWWCNILRCYRCS